MPHSLRAVLALLAIGFAAAPTSLYVQHLEGAQRVRVIAAMTAGGDPDAGKAAFARDGCSACHEIGAGGGTPEGKVGPPLNGLGKRAELAGRLANNPANLARWIRTPQEVIPGVGMPDQGLSERDARDIAAYLYTLD